MSTIHFSPSNEFFSTSNDFFLPAMPFSPTIVRTLAVFFCDGALRFVLDWVFLSAIHFSPSNYFFLPAMPFSPTKEVLDIGPPP